MSLSDVIAFFVEAFRFFVDNFSAIHLLMAVGAMLFAKRYSPQWKIAAAYVAVYCVAYLILVVKLKNGIDSGPQYYVYCIPFECVVIASAMRWQHPMGDWLKLTSYAAAGFHFSAFMAYLEIPLIHPVLRFLWSVHGVTIPIIELSQVAGIVVFALPMFKGLDTKDKERQVTWLAKTSIPQSR